LQRFALAQEAEMDAKGEAEAKAALWLYKQGRYEEAAAEFAKLSVDYPHMPIFERNVGACFYYLKRPEPALSNLRNYLNHKKDIASDDKAVVDKWIAEMEALRKQPATSPAPAVAPALHAPEPAKMEPPAESREPPAAGIPAPGPVLEPAPPSPAESPAPPPPALPTPAPVPTTRPAATVTPAAATLTAASPSQPSNEEDTHQDRPLYRTWWFWTGSSAVAAGVVTAIILLSGGSSSNVPGTALGNQGAFR
jgi:hypothetical protein